MEHCRSAHASADVCRASRKIPETLIVGDVEFAFESAVNFVDQFERAFQLQSRANRLHPEMIFLVDHDAKRLLAIHDDRTATAFGGVLPTDEMALDEHLFFKRRKILKQLGK